MSAGPRCSCSSPRHRPRPSSQRVRICLLPGDCLIQSALDNRTERAGGAKAGLRAGAPSLRQACPTARGVRALRAQFQLPNFNFGGGGGGGESSQQAGNTAMKQQLLDMCAAARQGIDGEWLWPAWPSKCGASTI